MLGSSGLGYVPLARCSKQCIEPSVPVECWEFFNRNTGSLSWATIHAVGWVVVF
jgi:hypothetical protein